MELMILLNKSKFLLTSKKGGAPQSATTDQKEVKKFQKNSKNN